MVVGTAAQALQDSSLGALHALVVLFCNQIDISTNIHMLWIFFVLSVSYVSQHCSVHLVCVVVYNIYICCWLTTTLLYLQPCLHA
jgi:hypothetical protein